MGEHSEPASPVNEGVVKMAKEKENVSMWRRIFITYTYVFIWIGLSFTVIMYNKYILSKSFYDWPFPISLTMIHMGFCSFLAFLLVRVFRVVEPVHMSRELYMSSVVPIGALYSLTLWFGNATYIYLSVSFVQMLKALMPVAVYSAGVLFKQDMFKMETMGNMIGISVGVAIAAYGEANFNLTGVMLQLASVCTESTRLVLVQILLGSKGITLNPITSLYYVAPCCFTFLAVPWCLVELPTLLAKPAWNPNFLLFGPNLACAFLLNLSVFLLIGKTSALTMNVAGVVKDWLLIAFSWHVIKDTVTAINLLGYGVAFLGVCYYNHCKLKAMMKAKESRGSEERKGEEKTSLLEELKEERERSKDQRR